MRWHHHRLLLLVHTIALCIHGALHSPPSGPSRATATGGAVAPVRHFINLSNGAEALPLLAAAGVAPEHVSFIRIQSSHCEAQDFHGILSNLDHNVLMHLALGYECRVYDFGSRGAMWETLDPGRPDGLPVDELPVAQGGAEAGSATTARGEGDAASPMPSAEVRYVPRALWWGLEWVRYALSRLWHLECAPPLLRGYNVQPRFDEQLRSLPKPLAKKLKYYRPYVRPELNELRLRGYYAQTALDGNKEAYRDFLNSHVAGSTALGTAAPDPTTFSSPMRAYDANVERRVLG